MEDTLLISIEDIKAVTSISDNIDVSMLEPFLATSQDMYIRPVVGDALMDAMIASVATGGTTYQSLIDNYVLKALAYSTWFSAAPFLHMKTQKKGIVLQSADDSTNISLDEWSVYSQRIENNMTFYLRRVKDYLDTAAAKALYPLYASNKQINPQNSSGIFLGYSRGNTKSRNDAGDCIDC